MSPAATLIAHLGLERRTSAEVRDLYSGPIAIHLSPVLLRAA